MWYSMVCTPEIFMKWRESACSQDVCSFVAVLWMARSQVSYDNMQDLPRAEAFSSLEYNL